jgi:hypothetical protein
MEAHVALARKTSKRDLLRDKFYLTGSFKVADIYNPDNPGFYLREMYGAHLKEFLRKFFIVPLDHDVHQTTGAIWSSHTGDSEGRGFGKSMLMCEESRLTNRDFGASVLAEFDIDEKDIITNPFIAGYCGFAENMNIKTFPAALLEGVVFALVGDIARISVPPLPAAADAFRASGRSSGNHDDCAKAILPTI